MRRGYYESPEIKGGHKVLGKTESENVYEVWSLWEEKEGEGKRKEWKFFVLREEIECPISAKEPFRRRLGVSSK